MKMKNTLWTVLSLVATVSMAQGTDGNANGADGEKTLFERVTNIEKKNDKFNMYLNMQAGLYTGFNQNGVDGFAGGAFKVPQLRLEVKGQLTDRLSYRWRQRLNKSYEPTGSDALPLAIDVAGVGIKATEGLSFFLGRQCVAYGGFEFDANPIDIYKYSELVAHQYIFMTGLAASYNFTPGQQMVFQVLNSNSRDATEFYGDSIEVRRMALVYSLGWNANMFDGLWQTRYSVSVMNETKDCNMYYVALGNLFTFSPKWNMYVDLMGSIENIDRKGMMTEIIGLQDNHNVNNAMYGAVAAKLNYRFHPKWNAFVKGTYDWIGMLEGGNGYSKGVYRTALNYLAGVEFYPMHDSDLHFFCVFTGQTNLYADKALMFNKSNYSTQNASIGFIYKLPVF